MFARYFFIALGIASLLWVGYVAADLIDKRNAFVPTSLFGKEQWEIRLRGEYLAGELGNTPPVIAVMIKRYAPIALLMDEFFQKLQKESKSTPYPAAQLEKLLRASSSETT